MTENSNDCGMMNSTLLPVGEAVEGPSICFRLVELGGGDADGATGCHGMRHNKFMALMMDATDNRCGRVLYLLCLLRCSKSHLIQVSSEKTAWIRQRSLTAG